MVQSHMVETPYQRKVLFTLNYARSNRHDDAEATLREMTVALQLNQYPTLRALLGKLPGRYAVMIGEPPPSRADDQ